MTIHQQYGRAREIFLQFKAGLESNDDLRKELLGALELLLTERSTSFYENRFITGGAAEHVIAAAMRCVGLSDVRTVGFEDVRLDVTVGGQGFSVANSDGNQLDMAQSLALQYEYLTRNERSSPWRLPRLLGVVTYNHVAHTAPEGPVRDFLNSDFLREYCEAIFTR